MIMCLYDLDKSFGKFEILNYFFLYCIKKIDSEFIIMIVVKIIGLDIFRLDMILYFFLNVIWNIYRILIVVFLNEVLYDY